MSRIQHTAVRPAERREDTPSTPTPAEVTGDIAWNIVIALGVALGASLIALAFGAT